MFSKELTELLVQVISSWQVIAVSIALIFFIYLVNYAARTYHRPASVSKSKPKKVKPPPAPKEEKKDDDDQETLPS